MPGRRVKLILFAAQVHPKRLHCLKLFKAGHLLQRENGGHRGNLDRQYDMASGLVPPDGTCRSSAVKVKPEFRVQQSEVSTLTSDLALRHLTTDRLPPSAISAPPRETLRFPTFDIHLAIDLKATAGWKPAVTFGDQTEFLTRSRGDRGERKSVKGLSELSSLLRVFASSREKI